MKLNQWIRNARTYAKLTQERLGEELGKSKGNISQWESGAHEPSFGQLLKIIKITNYPVPLPGLECNLLANWPFQNISATKINALSERNLIRLETGIELTAKDLKIDIVEDDPHTTAQNKIA